ncbi:MAG: hypothetical protein PHO15_05825 [Eubacteriales bacterium]|nr:hypothetical protein [Eubacteriales bacterium]
MVIITQDLDVIEKTEHLYTLPRFLESLFTGNPYILGINLYHANTLLGTFESIQEALTVMGRIETCTDEICFVEPNPELVRHILSVIGGAV